MSQPDDDSQRALERLNERLKAFKDPGTPNGDSGSPERGIGEGYRLLGETIGGVLGGFGLGWAVDRFAHTSPWGLIIGLLIGVILSVYAAVSTAVRISDRTKVKGAIPPGAPRDEGDD